MADLPPSGKSSRSRTRDFPAKWAVPDDRSPKPTGVKAPHGARTLEVSWADGHVCSYPHRLLRGYCPCAGCQGHTGTVRFIDGGNLELREIERVGNYALGFTWGDGHASGIYSFRYLRALCELIEEHGAEGLEKLGELPRI
jgi:DUF971 family protein